MTPFPSFCLDHDRPLSRTGQADAIEVSQKLQKLGWIPELILSRFVFSKSSHSIDTDDP